jgi:hypothetical protein
MIALETTLHGGIQKLYRFKNTFGGSVVKHQYSYGGHAGKWELAVIKWESNLSDWDLVYHTPITSDVLGWLDQEEVNEALEKIASLSRVAMWWRENISLKKSFPRSKLRQWLDIIIDKIDILGECY